MNNFYNKHKDTIRILLAVTISIAVRIFTISIYGIRYQTNDDATLSNIAAGGYGNDTLHMVYVNVLFSLLLRPLYALSSVNWYVIAQIILVVISIAVTINILIKKFGIFGGVTISLALLVAYAQHIFYTFKYTECSFIMLTAGLLLIADNLGNINYKTFFGIFLALMGSMVRWNGFFAVGGLSAAVLLYNFFRLDRKGMEKAVVTMIVFFTIIFGAKLIDVASYRVDPDWNEYNLYNEARMQYSDHTTLTLGEENPFRDKGITDVDYTILSNWDFYDEEKFTTELLESLSESNPMPDLNEVADKTVLQVKDMLYGETYSYMLLIAFVLAVLRLRPNRETIALIVTYIIFLSLLAFLMYNARFTSWVKMGLSWTLTVFSLYFTGCNSGKKLFSSLAITIAFAAIFCISMPEYRQLYIDYPNYVEWSKLEQTYFEDMNADKDHIYLLSTESINVAAGFDVMHPRTDNFYSNIVAFGGWLSRAPHRDQALANYGLMRPLVDAVDNPRVFLDYHNINDVVQYVHQETGKEVYAVKTGTNAFAPFQLITTKPEE